MTVSKDQELWIPGEEIDDSPSSWEPPIILEGKVTW